jgi:hypothetical protein
VSLSKISGATVEDFRLKCQHSIDHLFRVVFRSKVRPNPLTVQGARRDVYAGLLCNGDCTGFAGMMELTMVALRPYEIPSVRFNHLDKVSHLHEYYLHMWEAD